MRALFFFLFILIWLSSLFALHLGLNIGISEFGFFNFIYCFNFELLSVCMVSCLKILPVNNDHGFIAI